MRLSGGQLERAVVEVLSKAWVKLVTAFDSGRDLVDTTRLIG